MLNDFIIKYVIKFRVSFLDTMCFAKHDELAKVTQFKQIEISVFYFIEINREYCWTFKTPLRYMCLIHHHHSSPQCVMYSTSRQGLYRHTS